MNIEKMILDALNFGRSDDYDGHPITLRDCEKHLTSIFKLQTQTDKELAKTTMNTWWDTRS